MIDYHNDHGKSRTKNGIPRLIVTHGASIAQRQRAAVKVSIAIPLPITPRRKSTDKLIYTLKAALREAKRWK